MFQTWEYRISHPWYLNKTLFRLSTVQHKHNQSQKIINEFTDEIISTKIAELKRNIVSCAGENPEKEDDDDVGRKTRTVIEILLGNHHAMSHEQIRDEIVTIMIGTLFFLFFFEHRNDNIIYICFDYYFFL